MMNWMKFDDICVTFTLISWILAIHSHVKSETVGTVSSMKGVVPKEHALDRNVVHFLNVNNVSQRKHLHSQENNSVFYDKGID